MKALFCTDGSDASLYAIEKALNFLSKDSQIYLVNVMDWGFLPTYVTFPQEEEVGYPERKNAAELILERTKALIESKGYKVSDSHYFSGRPADEILELIKSEGYELAVLGSHGKKGVGKWLGSVSRVVVTKSQAPVFIARPPKNLIGLPKKSSKKVLFAVDGSECSYNAVTKAPEIFDLKDSEVEILTVRAGIDSFPVEITMDTEWLKDCIERQKEVAGEILQKTEDLLNQMEIKSDEKISLEGDSADMIIDYIEKNPKDLVVMGSHGRSGVSEFLLGSVSKRVLDNSMCPVLIIPPTKVKKH